MKYKFFPKTLLLICLFSFSRQVFAGGTVVGNGGDPVFEFMEAARTSMIETLKVIANDPNEQTSFCKQAPLSSDQTKFCHDYFLTLLPDMLRLSQGLNKTLFVLRDQPLLVTGPDGKPMVVAGRTDLGPQGPIELNRDAVKTMLPTQVLFLITHEFQHKANYNGGFVNDKDPIGPFSNGRDLIDNVAKYVVAVARRKGKVGSQFGIRDIFDCVAMTGTSQFGARLSSSRIFQTDDLMSYETSFGKNPTDGSIYLPETSNTALVLRFDITEPNNCGDLHQLRKTSVQIVRRSKLSNGSTQDAVVSDIESITNPMCPHSDSRIEISWQQIKFTCQYFGSEGTTSSAFSMRSLFRNR
ncbi:MAG: hypothetical protein ACXVB1_05935 [Pseudobdellovibrionaceae bacterium]